MANKYPALHKDTAKVGEKYAWCDGYILLTRVYDLTEEEATRFHLAYKSRFLGIAVTSGGCFTIGGALPGSEDTEAAKTLLADIAKEIAEEGQAQ